MKQIITTILSVVAKVIPLALFPNIVRRSSIDVFYHAVSDVPMAHVRHLYPVVPVAKFDAALVYLKKHYQFISYQQLHAHRLDGNTLPKRAVHLSFDDGFSTCFNIVRPLLRKHGIPCTFFVTTEWVDNHAIFYRNKVSLCVEALTLDPNKRKGLSNLAPNTENLNGVIQWLKELGLPDENLINEVCSVLGVDWDAFLRDERPYLSHHQIKQMHADGFTIGAHTKTHRKLADLSDTEKESEIIDSCLQITEITGQEIVPFSFPHSAYGVERNFLSDLRKRKPLLGLLFDTKDLRLDEKFIVNRVWAERPIAPTGDLRPLDEILRAAYRNAWVDGVMNLGRRLRGSNIAVQ